MFNWIDIVIAIIVLYNVVRGFSLGFIRSVIGIAGYVLAFWVSKEYHHTFTAYMLENFENVAQMKENLIFKIEEILLNSIEQGTANLTNGTLKGSGIPFLDNLNFNDISGVSSTAMTTAHDVATAVADFIISGIGAIVVFLGVLLIVTIIGIILNAIMKLPVLAGVNRFAGLLVGLLKGNLLVFSIMTLLAFISPMINNTGLMQALYESKVGMFFYNNNILLMLINRYLLG